VLDPVSIGLAIKAATTAIDMAKKGVALYKEIKATAGDVSGVLKDLKDQYHKIVDPSPEQKKQYHEEVQRVQKIKDADPHQVLDDIWEHLGSFVDEYDKILKAYIAEEATAKELYKGSESIARRALRRIKIRTQLDAMLAEVRQEMVWNTPSELGDVWTRFEAMWQTIVLEQNEALAVEVRKAQIARWRRNQTINKAKALAAWIGAIVFVLLWMWGVLILIRTSQTYRGLLFYVSP
jgi:hypothetical protein